MYCHWGEKTARIDHKIAAGGRGRGRKEEEEKRLLSKPRNASG
jgi:hypothetical protein